MQTEHRQAALFTLALHAGLLALLVFSGFRLVVPPPKGQGISAELVDISQLKWPKKSQTTKNKLKPAPVKKKAVRQKPVPEKKPPPKPVKKTVAKPKPKPKPKPQAKPKPKPKPKIDTRARDLQRQQDLERQRKLQEIRKKRQAAEKQRQLEAERLKQLEARQASQKTDPKQALAAGAVNGSEKARNDLLARYVQSIKARVASNWARPPTTPKGLRCRVRVKQIPGGGVIDATISSPCNADALVKKSIINAVKRSDPLPYTGFEDVFERTLSFTFTYDGEN
jgi:colicin import membrane protein